MGLDPVKEACCAIRTVSSIVRSEGRGRIEVRF
jgi:hypothetical protein